MIWLSLALTAWAGVAAYGIWAWRDDRRADRAEKREELARADRVMDRTTDMIRKFAELRERPAPSPAVPDGLNFPARGDNFTTITPENVIEFGKRPRTQDETPTQPCA